MTLKELSQLYYLNREIEMDKDRLEKLRTKASGPSGPNLTGIPGGGSYENSIERYIAEIVDLEEIISAKIRQCEHERNRLEKYIADIDDSQTRQILTLKFVNGLNWVKTAERVGGGNSADGVRQRVYRYLRTNKQKN